MTTELSALPPLFFKIFDQLDRQGPGNPECTRRAFLSATSVSATSVTTTSGGFPSTPTRTPGHRILDIGCGAGGQTLTLAELDPAASILAIDAHAPFVDTLNRLAQERGLSNRLRARVGDMAELDLPPGSVDLIWCEGAAYHVGVGPGLRAWRPLLAPGGRIALSELCWLTDARPEACAEFWMREYPAIGTIAQNLAIIDEAGFGVIDHFVLPDAAWWTHFYDQLEQNVARQRELRRGHAEDLELIEQVQAEIDQRRRFPEYYGYVFFIVEPR